jgi:hypothetical protein
VTFGLACRSAFLFRRLLLWEGKSAVKSRGAFWKKFHPDLENIPLDDAISPLDIPQFPYPFPRSSRTRGHRSHQKASAPTIFSSTNMPTCGGKNQNKTH